MAAVGARAFIIVELFRLESRYARMGAFAADFKARRPWQTKQARWRAAGFPELGFLPGAFINLLATLGWNDGTDQELFTLEELVEKFSIERVHKGGAKFDFEKAKWFNAEWIRKSEAGSLKSEVRKVLEDKGINAGDDAYLLKVIDKVKDRCVLLADFYRQSAYFFEQPKEYDMDAVKPKWTDAKTDFFNLFTGRLNTVNEWHAGQLENLFKALAEEKAIKPGELLLPLRIMREGGKFGPGVFDIAELLGRDETIRRIELATKLFN